VIALAARVETLVDPACRAGVGAPRLIEALDRMLTEEERL
jgi:hypothetical protein